MSPKSPANTVSELTDLLRGKALSKFAYTNQVGQLAAEAYKSLAGLTSVPVTYKTAADLIPDIEDGTIDYVVIDGTFGTSQIKLGRIKALAVTSLQRSPTLPQVPTMEESGLTGFEWVAWWGLYLPAGTPQNIVGTYTRWLSEVTKTDETRNFLATVSAIPLSDGPEAANKRLTEDMERWGSAARAAGIQPQ